VGTISRYTRRISNKNKNNKKRWIHIDTTLFLGALSAKQVMKGVRCLDLSLLVDREHAGMVGRVDVRRDGVARDLAANFGSFENLNRHVRCGWRAWTRRMG
jgi:hypothetical protein